MPTPRNPALAAHLLAHSVRTGDFTLKSGKQSTWFIDSKQTICRPDGLLLVAEALLAVLPDDISAIGGMTMGADGVAFGVAGVAAARGRMLNGFSVRKEVKDHGGGGRVAGALVPGDRVAIVEDTTTRGVSTLDCIPSIEAAGATPVMVVVVVDRGGTAQGHAIAAGLAYESLVTAPELGFAFEGA